MANILVVEVGLAIALLVVAVGRNVIAVAIGAAILIAATAVALLRWRGQWLTQTIGLELRFAFRPRAAARPPIDRDGLVDLASDGDGVIGAKDPRVNVLRAAIPQLVVARGSDHDRLPVGLAWDRGIWTAVLLVEPTPALVSRAGDAGSLPLSVLEPCLEDRGVILDSIQVIWHAYPGSAALPANSPALRAYLEVLGPLPAAARRTTWVAVRLDPRRCPAAIQERGGGVVGAHRALIGALSRVRNALDSRGIPTRPLDADELLKAGVTAGELLGAVTGGGVRLQEQKMHVAAGGIRHSSYAITRWPKGRVSATLNSLTSVRALSTTVAMTISPTIDEGLIGLRGVVRVSARNGGELEAADKRLTSIADNLGIVLTPLRGRQLDGLAATLPMGGAS